MNRWRWFSYVISAGALAWVGVACARQGVWDAPWPAMRGGAVAVLVALMPVNWGLEVAKWRHLQPGVTWRAAAREVLIGAAAAFLTPNRLGDVAGRVGAAPAERRERAGRAFTTAAASQLFVTLAAGAAALGARGGWAAPALGLALAAYLLWSPRLPEGWRRRLGWKGPAPAAAPASRRGAVLALSAARYAVFSGQFWLAFSAFGLAVNPADIPLIFLGNAAIPSAAFGELGVREAMTLAVVRPEGAEVGAAVAAAFVVWAVNLAVPAVGGALLNLRRR